jgi:PAS domain-containing protein
MGDEHKTKEQLINELAELRQRIADMETTGDEHKWTGGKIKQAIQEWQTTFDSIRDLISIHDENFKLVRVNKAFADAFKMESEELIGKTCYEIVLL